MPIDEHHTAAKSGVRTPERQLLRCDANKTNLKKAASSVWKRGHNGKNENRRSVVHLFRVRYLKVAEGVVVRHEHAPALELLDGVTRCCPCDGKAVKS
jgi:hypothetical protein